MKGVMFIMITTYENVQVMYPAEMSQEEAISYVQEELDANPRMRLTKIEIRLGADQQDVELVPQYDTISRVRRITGYLSTIPKFNDAKRAEEHDRVSHFG